MTNGEKGIAAIALLAVLLWHAQDARMEAEQPLEDLRRDLVELQVRAHDLEEENAVLENNPDLSKYQEAMKTKTAIVTAYNTVEGQTDSTPCIAANGQNICGIKKCVVAHQTLPFGTRIALEGFGDCYVMDRLNARYGPDRIDVSFDKDVAGAWEFGKRELTYVVK